MRIVANVFRGGRDVVFGGESPFMKIRQAHNFIERAVQVFMHGTNGFRGGAR